MNGIISSKQRKIAAVTTETKLVVRAMRDIWSHPHAYELIRARLRGREVESLTEQELMQIIASALQAVQSGI
jgi:hypothetical protein